MMHNIFVYGTLLFPEITGKLTGKLFKTSPAVLHGYKIYLVKGSDYPAIFPEKGASTKGNILFNLDDSDIEILTFFEGDQYKTEKASILQNGKPLDTNVFIWAKAKNELIEQEWNINQFRLKSLHYYLDFVVPETLNEFCRK